MLWGSSSFARASPSSSSSSIFAFAMRTFTHHTSWVTCLALLPDGLRFVSGSRDKTVKLFNVNDGGVLRTFKHHTDMVGCLELLPDGLRFVSGADDQTACIVYHGLAPQ